MAAVFAVFSAVSSFIQGRQQAKQAKKANRLREQSLAEEREARDVRTAEAKNRINQERIQKNKERRIKVAQIQQGGQNLGVGNSSIVSGASGAVTSNFAGVVARSAATTKAIEGINAAQDRAATLNVQAQNTLNKGPSTFALAIGAIGQLGQGLSDSGVFGDSFNVPKQNYTKTPNGDEGIFGL